MNWDDVSDFEINKAVAESLGFKVYKIDVDNGEYKKTIDVQESEKGHEVFLRDYCNSWADMGPLISESEISLINMLGGYQAVANYSYIDLGGVFEINDCCIGGDEDFVTYGHTNLLRAAAIVYLMMYGVKPEDCK